MLSRAAETLHNKEDRGLDTYLLIESCPKTSSLRNKLAGHNNDHQSYIQIDFLVSNHGMFDLNRIFLLCNVDPYNIHGISWKAIHHSSDQMHSQSQGHMISHLL